MKRFEMKQIREAVAYSMQGGQALHVHTLNSGHWLFRRYPVIGHYFDQDINRLIYVSRRFGVRVIKVECEGTPKQHIDLCGKPFELACQVCNLTPDAADERDAPPENVETKSGKGSAKHVGSTSRR